MQDISFALKEASEAKMCRPGTGPGMVLPKNPQIIFPENQKIDTYPELRDDFINKVLRIEWAWVSDESSLWDFHTDEDNSEMYLKIGEVYGVDVSHIASGKLVEIFEEIMTQIGTFPENENIRAVRLAREARDRHVAGLPPLPWNADPQT